MNMSLPALRKTFLASMLVLFSAGVQLDAQKLVQIVPTPEDIYDQAGEYILSFDYNEALYLYLSLEDKGYHTANISYKIGECYLNIPGQKLKALPYLKEAVQSSSHFYDGKTIDEKRTPLKALLYLGVAYRLDYEFDKAINTFNILLDSISGEDSSLVRLIHYHIDRCENANELIKSPMKYEVSTLPPIINTVFSNYNPLVTEDEKMMIYMDQLKFYDAVMQVYKEDTTWQKPENITPDIKSDGDHYAVGLSSDGKKLLLSAYDPYKSGEIYMAEWQDGKWSEMHRLNDNINSQFNETHASLSTDGKTLYFTSDRKGGYGGLDIYCSHLDANNDWGPAINLGPLINTQYNEETPFITSDSKKLFFSSQGHYNMGGYDIFCSTLSADGTWQSPVNIGYPVNTPDDDIFFFPLDTGKIAYQSRYEDNSANQDIYRYVILSYGNPARFTIKGKVNIENNKEYNPRNVSVSFFDKTEKDTVGIQNLQKDGTFSQKLPGGSFTVDFNDKGKTVSSKDVNIPSNSAQDEFVMNTSIKVQVESRKDTFIIHAIHFDFDKILPDAQSKLLIDQLVQLLIKYPQLLVKLTGYADALGGNQYNLKLSIHRAKAVGDYLKDANIASDRISVEGKGENDPVALNTNKDGSDCPEGRKFNRRVEIQFSNVPDSLVVLIYDDVPGELKSK